MGIFDAFKKDQVVTPPPFIKAKVVSVLNQKGGVGKTTLTFNLARALSEKGHQVLCLDLDPQANLSLLFGHEAKIGDKHIFHLLMNSVRELRALHSGVMINDLMFESAPGLWYIPSGQDLSGFELSVAGITSPRQLIFKRFLEKSGVLGRFDYILIDGPPTLGLLVVNALCASQGVVIPFQPDRFSRSGLGHFHEVLENIEDMGVTKTPQVLGYIPNLVEPRRKQTQEDFELIQDDLNKSGDNKILEAIPNRVQLAKSSRLGKSVFDFSSKDYKELQDQFLSVAQSIEEGLSE